MMLRKNFSLYYDWKEDYKYPFFLISMVVFLFFPSMVGQKDSTFLTNILFIVFILSSLTLIDAKSRLVKVFTYVVGILAISAETFSRLISPPSDLVNVILIVFLCIYFISLIIELLNQIFSSKIITLNVVLGAFTGYILIGILGYLIFRLIFLLDPDAFALFSYSTSELFYFTFITLTTIGYGDISPVSEAARNFSMLLGLVGQFYNTVIIAIIIGKFLQK